MTRRLLAVLLCSTLAFVVTLRADPPTPPVAKNTPAKSVDASPDEVRRIQDKNAREYKQFEELLLRLAIRMERGGRPEDKDKAKALRDAITLANQQAVENRFSKLLSTLVGKDSAKNLTTDELEKAAGQNEELVKILRDMLELLLTDNEILRKRQEAANLEKMIKQVEGLIREEKRIQANTDGNKVDSKAIGKDQGKATVATESLARQMGAKPNDKADGKEGDAKKGDPNAKPGEPKEDAKGPKGDQKEPKPGEPKDPKAGDAKAGDPKAGDPKAGDPKAGDPKAGDPKAGDAKSPPKPSDPKDQKQANNKPSEPKAKPDNKGDAKPSDGEGKPSDGDPKQANGQGKPSQGQPQQGQPKPNDQQQANKPPSSQDPQQQDLPGKKQIQDAIEGQKKTEQELEKDKKVEASKNLDKVIEDLESVKKELEKRLKQLREEELERLLANLQSRCERMLAMQIEVYEGTKRVYAVVETYPDKKPTRPEEQRSQQLSTREGEIVKEAHKTMGLLQDEGSAVAFAMTLESVRDDMIMIEKRLDKYDTAKMTQRMEEDVIAALKDMIAALKKAQQDMKDNKNNPKPSPPGQPPPQKLLDLLAEIKLIKTLQLQVNKRTKDYAALYNGEQADEKNIQDELNTLAKRQEKVEQMTKDIATGKNR